MNNQKHLFSIEEGLRYINCAAYSPTLKSTVERGIESMMVKANRPSAISAQSHFEPADSVRKLFSKLVNIDDPQRVVIISAVSYGMAIVANNIHRLPNIAEKKHIILIQDEFPDNVYAFERVCEEHNLSYKTIEKPDTLEERGKQWNARILNEINAETAMVVAPNIHWIYGVKFDLEQISKRCKEVGALLIIDATQSIGALDFDVQKVQPDALICGGYKWLLGPYGIGVAYLGSFFDDGVPVEESWLNRVNSEKFAQLTNYERAYRPKAQRYNTGEYSQFINMPMFEDSLTQLLAWGIDNIQSYCKNLIQEPLVALQNLGCTVEAETYRASHLLGIGLPAGINSQTLTEKLAANKITVSNRGVLIRVAPNVYNTEEDMWALVEVLKKSI